MAEPQDEHWPTLEQPTLAPYEPATAPLPPPPPDRRIGAGMLLALGAIGLVVIGGLLALLLVRHDNATSTTVVVQGTSPPTTTPAATTTAAGGAAATRRVAVPDLVGRQVADAQRALQKLGLRVALTTVTDSQPAGTIVDQQPPAGSRQAKGRVVTLAVARSRSDTTTPTTTVTTTTAQPADATVPDVGGQTEQAAANAFSRAGILPSLVFVPNDDPLGTVEQQAKASGTVVPFHSHVQLNVSRGPGEKENEQVPNVIGRTLTDAVGALNAAKLRLIYVRLPVTSDRLAGKVVQQSPLGGGTAPQNAQVLVFLGVRS